jgi:hypothetical protein
LQLQSESKACFLAYHGVLLSKIFHQYSGIWPAPQKIAADAGSPSSTESACCTFTMPENGIVYQEK